MKDLLSFISDCLFFHFGEKVHSSDYSCLFCENPKKFSCHVILNKNGLYFRNNIHLGKFMQWAVACLENTPTSLYSALFVKNKEKRVFVADMAVFIFDLISL